MIPRFLSKRFICLGLAIILLILIIYFNLNKVLITARDEIQDKFIQIKNVENEAGGIIEELRLVNLTKFQYLLKPSDDLCEKFKDDDLLGILIITSYVGHDEIRAAHRQAISAEKLQSLGLARVFLLAAIPSQEHYITQLSILNESERFNDLLQGDFMEAYRNLTYKHVMGLKWATLDCSNARFIVKIDDDTVFDIFHLQNYLQNLEISPTNNNYLLAGYILNDKKPIRLNANKWYVTYEEFNGDVYPDYLSGWLYITNPKTANLLVIESQTEPFFWIDDTWITGVLRDKQGIPLTRLNKWFSANSQFLDCCLSDLKKYSFKCDYNVGPNGGDVKLITNFIQEMGKCYDFDDNTNVECIERTPDKMVSRTCVGRTKDVIGQHGDAEIKLVKL